MKVHSEDAAIFSILECNMKYGPWVAGGACIQWYQGKEVGLSDIDVWVSSSRQYEMTKRKLESKSFSVIYESENAVTYIHKVNIFNYTNIANGVVPVQVNNKFSDLRIQVIKKNYQTVQDVINDFDFTVCQIATDGTNFVFGPKTREHIDKKILETTKIKESLHRRFAKYYSYGYEPTEKTIAALSTFNNHLNFNGTNEYD